MARSTRYNIMCKVCQWLAAGRWFSQGTPVSSTNKTDRHDITEILLKVGLNTITLTPFCFVIVLCCFALMVFHLWIWLWWRGKFASPPNRYFSQITLTNRIYLYNIHLPNWKTTWNIFAWIWKENLTMIANLVQQNWSIWYCFFLFCFFFSVLWQKWISTILTSLLNGPITEHFVCQYFRDETQTVYKSFTVRPVYTVFNWN